MDWLDAQLARSLARRRLLGVPAALGAVLGAGPALGQLVDLALPGGGSRRVISSGWPGKSAMIVQRERPPLLETPMAVFDRDIYTPNDRFFVRWHWSDIPTAVDVDTFRLVVTGLVQRPIAIPLGKLLRMPRVELAAVNQCSGNSRGLFQPRVPGAQWGHGAMGNARWTGVRLRDVLDLAGVRPGAAAVRFNGLDQPLMPGAPDFVKALALNHARDGEVMIAFQMNGEQLPLLNGFPLRLVVPGWYSTYWTKALNRIDVLGAPDDNYWMAKAYKIPTAPHASVAPGSKGFPTEPIHRMIPRSWITSLPADAPVAYEPELSVGGIAMGGDTGVAKVELSSDGGHSWRTAILGPDAGKYSFRRFDGQVPARRGVNEVLARCINTRGEMQPMQANWNPGGYMRGCVEVTRVTMS